MQFEFTEEEQMIRETASQFSENQLKHNAQKLDEGDYELYISQIKELAELGFMGMTVQEQYGGIGGSTVAFSLAVTEIARGCASTATATSVTNMVAEVIQAVGNEEQKAHYLPKFCTGEFLAGAFCLTEPSAGSDPSAMRTTAVEDGDNYILNGSKIFITSAKFAGVFVVWAVTDPNAPRGKGISCFLIDANTPGMNIAKPEDKMGQRASSTCEVSFNDCVIPKSSLMGELNKGFKIAIGELAGGRIGIGSLALGIGLEAMDYASDYIKERKQFGQELSRFQGLQFMVSDRYTELEASRLLLLQAAYNKDQGLPFGTAASMAKLFASEKANDACYTALQCLGGAGYIKEYPVERFVRDVRLTAIYEGTSEIQRVIIARDKLQS